MKARTGQASATTVAKIRASGTLEAAGERAGEARR